MTGAHSFKFGGELRRDQIKVSFINRPNGDFTFAGTQYSGNAAADFLLGFPVQYRQATGDPNLDGSSWVYSLYAQDDRRRDLPVAVSGETPGCPVSLNATLRPKTLQRGRWQPPL